MAYQSKVGYLAKNSSGSSKSKTCLHDGNLNTYALSLILSPFFYKYA